ncbi:MAG: YraN family protein [Lachnospiraceae bacterium]|nr:YraN family protein [Lachnospiraceae bacterium]
MNTREKGKRGEELAAEHIRTMGGRIKDSNFYFKGGEIDLVVEDRWLNENWLCFVEVKLRDDLEAGYPEEAVTPAKQKKIIKGALAYMNYKKIPSGSVPVRFDVVAILGNEVKWIKNAFTA